VEELAALGASVRTLCARPGIREALGAGAAVAALAHACGLTAQVFTCGRSKEDLDAALADWAGRSLSVQVGRAAAAAAACLRCLLCSHARASAGLHRGPGDGGGAADAGR